MAQELIAEERRQYSRVPFQGKAQIIMGKQSVSASQLDVSLAGTLLVLDQYKELRVGSIYQLKLVFGEGPEREEFEISATLAHQQRERLGFKFEQRSVEAFSYLCNVLLFGFGDEDLVDKERKLFLSSQRWLSF